VLSHFDREIDISSTDAFVESIFGALTSDALKEWVKKQGDFHLRMDMDLITERTDKNKATLRVFSVNAMMLIKDSVWDSVDCKSVTDYLKAGGCNDGGSENKLFYKNTLSLKQFIMHDLPPEEKAAVFREAYELFIGDEKNVGFSNIQTFSGIPFFHMKPFSLS
jgi:hypothetical protein